MMTERSDEIDKVKKSIDRERTNLLTVIAALSFLCICLFVSNVSLGAYTVSAINERDAVSIALDDQRTQYYRCIRDAIYTDECSQEMVSPASRDIKRDLESAGFSDLLYANDHEESDDNATERETGKRREAFGLLGYVIYR